MRETLERNWKRKSVAKQKKLQFLSQLALYNENDDTRKTKVRKMRRERGEGEGEKGEKMNK
jgi:hypothetical protein